MTQIFDDLITPVAKAAQGYSLYTAAQVLTLAMGMSDFGRDYNLDYNDTRYNVGIDQAVMEVLEGHLQLDESVIERIETIHENFQEVISKVIVNVYERGFTYITEDREESRLDKDSLIPIDVARSLASFSFSVMKNFYLKAITTDGFLGEIGGKLNGLPLTYFHSKYINFDNPSPYASGFYLHQFLAPGGEIVSWKTGKYSGFVRGGTYILVGGSVKTHNRYKDYPVETVLTRAKFFDNQTNDKYVDPS